MAGCRGKVGHGFVLTDADGDTGRGGAAVLVGDGDAVGGVLQRPYPRTAAVRTAHDGADGLPAVGVAARLVGGGGNLDAVAVAHHIVVGRHHLEIRGLHGHLIGSFAVGATHTKVVSGSSCGGYGDGGLRGRGVENVGEMRVGGPLVRGGRAVGGGREGGGIAETNHLVVTRADDEVFHHYGLGDGVPAHAVGDEELVGGGGRRAGDRVGDGGIREVGGG